MFGAIAGGIASALAGGAMSKLFGGGQKAASGGIQDGFNRTLDAINNVFRKFSAFHDETGRLNVDGMNIISNDGSNKLNRSRKARGSYKVQRTINASLNAATSTRAVDRKSGSAGMPRPISYAVFCLKKKKIMRRGRAGTPSPVPVRAGDGPDLGVVERPPPGLRAI